MAEIFLIYLLSNIPFFLTALEQPIASNQEASFYESFIKVLNSEIAKGQLLTFVCALIAPVVFWSFVEFKKAFRTKILSLSALILLSLSAYLHGKGEDFEYFTSFNLYQAALVIWIFSILSKEIPPNRRAFFEIAQDQTDNFVNLTRGS